jgi:hypothetical protein
VVQVTASALGASSVPTYVFVHPQIDTITVTGVLLDNVPVQEPCLSQSQTMTVEAHAFSHGSDITSSVGPFTWSADNSTVVTLTPLVNIAYNFATNQATAKAAFPGIAQIHASASGVTSSSFQQPQYQNSVGTSPVLDFFSTCPIQNISLELGEVGSGQTSLVATKGSTTSQTVFATITDIMGKSSLPNTNGDVVLSKIPLTWTASQPTVLNVSGTCLESCVLSTPSSGAGSVTASCSPPTCNIGFPTIPASLSSTTAIDACTQFFQAQYPKFLGCQQLIPVPVYASPLPASSNATFPGDGAISGLVTGATASAALLATSTGCAHEVPGTCSTAIYNPSSSKAASGSETPMPDAPNSLLFDIAGDRAYMGSDFGAQMINPSSFGTNNNPFSSLGTVTGKVLAISNNGTIAVFSDTVHTPNQLYVVNTATATNLSANAFNVTGASAAAFSPDGLKTFINGGTDGSSLYVYSPLQALQGPIALFGPADAIAFSPNGAFAFVAESSTASTAANLSAFSTCNNQLAISQDLGLANVSTANPILMKVLPGEHLNGRDSSGNLIPDGIHVFVLDATGFDVITYTISPPVAGTHCPQVIAFANPLLPLQRVELGQGTLQPVNFFTSADGSQLYVASADHASILVYDFGTGSVTGIELTGNATPLSADMSADAGTIVIAGSDGLLHSVSTGLGGSDQIQISFPNLPDYLNAFCTITPTAGPCAVNLALARP